MKQLSSMMVGLACSGSKTPPMPTPPERCTLLADLRARAHGRPGVDHRAFVDVGADVDVATASARRSARCRRRGARPPAARRARRPAAKAGVVELRELGRHLVVEAERHLGPASPIGALSASRNDSSTAFLIHWCVTHSPSRFSATRRRPASSSAMTRGDGVAHLAAGPSRARARRAAPTRRRSFAAGCSSRRRTAPGRRGQNDYFTRWRRPATGRWPGDAPAARRLLHRLEQMGERAADRQRFRCGA